MDILQELEAQGRLVIHNVIPDYANPSEVREAVREVIGDCRALICRPTRGGRVTDEMIEGVKEPFYIATISKGVDHIVVMGGAGRIEIIRAQGDGNASAVAELAMLLACLLLRPVHRGVWQVAHRGFDNTLFGSSKGLDSLTWVCLGSGAQVGSLLERLLGWRLGRIVIYNPRMDEARLQMCLSAVAHAVRDDPVLPGGGAGPEGQPKQLRATVSCGEGAGVQVEGTRDLHRALSQADIVSIHLPLTRPENSPGGTHTYHMFDDTLIRSMKKGAVLVNVSRGDIVDEDALLDALLSRRLYGYGADVINQEAEESGNPDQSPLWAAVISERDNLFGNPGKPFNVLLTPHLGGSTAAAVGAVADDVVIRLLYLLGVDW